MASIDLPHRFPKKTPSIGSQAFFLKGQHLVIFSLAFKVKNSFSCLCLMGIFFLSFMAFWLCFLQCLCFSSRLYQIYRFFFFGYLFYFFLDHFEGPLEAHLVHFMWWIDGSKKWLECFFFRQTKRRGSVIRVYFFISNFLSQSLWHDRDSENPLAFLSWHLYIFCGSAEGSVCFYCFSFFLFFFSARVQVLNWAAACLLGK